MLSAVYGGHDLCDHGQVPGAPPLSAEALRFVAERRLATLSTCRPDGSLHVVPVGFTWDQAARKAWVISSSASTKVANIRAGSRACLCQADGRRWLSLEGAARVDETAGTVAEAERRYALRYRAPRDNPRRVCITIDVERVMGSL